MLAIVQKSKPPKNSKHLLENKFIVQIFRMFLEVKPMLLFNGKICY